MIMKAINDALLRKVAYAARVNRRQFVSVETLASRPNGYVADRVASGT
jgi:hypothetical protein